MADEIDSTKIKIKKSWFRKYWIYILIGTLCIVYLGWAIPYWVCHPSEAGQFGDLFGAITALIGTFSVILLIQSLRLQRKELKIARQEMREANQINAEQLRTNVLMQENNRLQRFENIFFRMLERLSLSRTKVLAIDENGTQLKGEFAFYRILEFVNQFFFKGGLPVSYDAKKHDAIGIMYRKGDQSNFRTEIYYKEFENIFVLLFESDLPLSVQRFYIKILKTHIDNPNEVVLLYYYVAFRIDPNEDLRLKIKQSLLFSNMTLSKFPDSANENTYHQYLFPDDEPIN